MSPALHRLVAAALLALFVAPAQAQTQESCDPIGGGLEFCAAETAFVRREDGDRLYTNAAGASGSETFLDFRIFDPIDPMPSYDEAFPMALEVMAQEYGITAADFEPLPLFDSEVGIAGESGVMRFYNVGAGRIPDFAFDLTFGIALLLDESRIVMGTSTEMARQPGFGHTADVFLALKMVQPEGGTAQAPPADPPLATAAASTAEGPCNDIGKGVAFCYGGTAFSPIEGDLTETWYSNVARGRDTETVLLISTIDAAGPNVGYPDLFALLRKVEAGGYGIEPSALTEIVPPRPASVAGQNGQEAYYRVTGGTIAGEPNPIVLGYAVLLLPGYTLVVQSKEYGTIPSAGHVMDLEAARAAIRLPGAAPAEDPAAEALQALLAPPGVGTCDDLAAGVQLCDLRSIDWKAFTPASNGRIQVAIGDTAGVIWAEPFDGFTPPISEQARHDLQDKLHGRMVDIWLENQGIANQDAGIGHLLGMRVGAHEEAPLAQFMTLMVEGDDGPETAGITLYLAADHYVVLLSTNPGHGTSEDHFFLAEELMRGVRSPG